jgi:hypothetical protein
LVFGTKRNAIAAFVKSSDRHFLITDVEAAAAKEEKECKQNGGSSCIPNRYCEWYNAPIRWELFKYKKANYDLIECSSTTDPVIMADSNMIDSYSFNMSRK